MSASHSTPPRPDVGWQAGAWSEPPRRRGNAWPWVAVAAGAAGVVILVTAVVLAVQDGGTHAARVDAPDATFVGPPGWTHTSGQEGIVHDPGFLSNAVWEENFVRDRVDVIFVAKLHLEGLSLAPEEFHTHLDEIKAGLERGLRSAGATVVKAPTETELDGMPGLDLEIERTAPGSGLARSRLVVGYSGADQYLIRCQFDEPHETEVRAACDRVIQSFRRT